MTSKTRRDLTLLLLLVVVDTLPFLNRAVHLDENTYLAIARNVSRNFWFPQDFPGQWFGIPVLNFGGHTHPVGLAYFLALLMKIFHTDAEWAMRLGFMIFPIGFAVGGYFLARRFTNHPLLTAILMMVTPATLVFSPTLMPDLPMTTLWLFAILNFVSGMGSEKSGKIVWSGLLLALAALISYQAIFMSGLLAIYAWTRGKRRAKILFPLILPVVFLGFYWYVGSLHYGHWQAVWSKKFLSTGNIFGLEYFRQKLIGMFTTLGATTFFGLSILWWFGKSSSRKSLFTVLALTLVSGLLVPRDYKPYEYLEFFIFCAAGVVLLWVVLGWFGKSLKPSFQGTLNSADDFFLTLWILGVVVYTILLCEFSAARYMAAIVPPLTIFFVRRLEPSGEGQQTFFRRFFRTTVVATWIVAVAVAYADYQFVGSYRDFSKGFAARYSGFKGRVWVGTEAGLRYYMQREGARTLVNPYGAVIAGVLPGAAWGEAHFGHPALNDLLVRPADFLRYDLAVDLESSSAIDSKTLVLSFPVRTYGPAAHAGLHGTNVGLLPFTFSRQPLDQIEISQYNVFAASFSKAQKVTKPGQQIEQTFFTLQGRRRGVIDMSPESALIYAVARPGPMLTGEWGMDDNARKNAHCRIHLTLSVQPGEELPFAPCVEQELDATVSREIDAPSLQRFSCDVASREDHPVAIKFQTNVSAPAANACPPVGLTNLQFTAKVPGF